MGMRTIADLKKFIAANLEGIEILDDINEDGAIGIVVASEAEAEEVAEAVNAAYGDDTAVVAEAEAEEDGEVLAAADEAFAVVITAGDDDDEDDEDEDEDEDDDEDEDEDEDDEDEDEDDEDEDDEEVNAGTYASGANVAVVEAAEKGLLRVTEFAPDEKSTISTVTMPASRVKAALRGNGFKATGETVEAGLLRVSKLAFERGDTAGAEQVVASIPKQPSRINPESTDPRGRENRRAPMNDFGGRFGGLGGVFAKYGLSPAFDGSEMVAEAKNGMSFRLVKAEEDGHYTATAKGKNKVSMTNKIRNAEDLEGMLTACGLTQPLVAFLMEPGYIEAASEESITLVPGSDPEMGPFYSVLVNAHPVGAFYLADQENPANLQTLFHTEKWTRRVKEQMVAASPMEVLGTLNTRFYAGVVNQTDVVGTHQKLVAEAVGQVKVTAREDVRKELAENVPVVIEGMKRNFFTNPDTGLPISPLRAAVLRQMVGAGIPGGVAVDLINAAFSEAEPEHIAFAMNQAFKYADMHPEARKQVVAAIMATTVAGAAPSTAEQYRDRLVRASFPFTNQAQPEPEPAKPASPNAVAQHIMAHLSNR